MSIKSLPLGLILLLYSFSFLQSQDSRVIQLVNPSFEDIPQHSKVPKGWMNFGVTDESPPDTHPSGEFGVTISAFDGATYLGLVTRDNGTWEAVQQRLSQPLKANQDYVFQLRLAKSESYFSLSRFSGSPFVEANYITPVILRIWGSNMPLKKEELLAESQGINHTDWQLYQFLLSPQKDYSFIALEAFYDKTIVNQQAVPPLPKGNYTLMNGNLLVDNASPIIEKAAADSVLLFYKKEFDGVTYKGVNKDSAWAGYNPEYVKYLKYQEDYNASTSWFTLNAPKRTVRSRQLSSPVSRTVPSKTVPSKTISIDENHIISRIKMTKQNPRVIDQLFMSLNSSAYFNFLSLFQESPYLQQIAIATEYLNSYDVVLAVKGKDEKQIEKRKKSLLKKLARLKLKEEQFIFEPWPTNIKEENWIELYGADTYIMKIIKK